MRLRALAIPLLTLVLVACGGAAPSQTGSTSGGGTPGGSEAPRTSSTADTVGYGVNATGAVADLSQVFGSVQQATQLQLTANSTPAGATGADVQSISIVAQDKGGLLKSLDAAGKQSLGNALLTAAAAAWPNADISLLVSDPAGGGGTIIGNHPKTGQNTIIAS